MFGTGQKRRIYKRSKSQKIEVNKYFCNFFDAFKHDQFFEYF